VLKQDHIDIHAIEDPRRAYVVAANLLENRCSETLPLGARRLVYDNDPVDPINPSHAQERAPHICRKRSDTARPRRIRRNQCNAQ
jgi:hypothetical protein